MQILQCLSGRIPEMNGLILHNFIDSFSKRAWSFVVSAKSGSETLRVIKELFVKMGEKPLLLRTDNGTEYMNEQVQLFLKSLPVIHRTGQPYSPH